MAPAALAARLKRPVDRLPTRRELLDVIRWHQYLVRELAGDRNRLAGNLADLLLDRAGGP